MLFVRKFPTLLFIVLTTLITIGSTLNNKDNKNVENILENVKVLPYVLKASDKQNNQQKDAKRYTLLSTNPVTINAENIHEFEENNKEYMTPAEMTSKHRNRVYVPFETVTPPLYPQLDIWQNPNDYEGGIAHYGLQHDYNLATLSSPLMIVFSLGMLSYVLLGILKLVHRILAIDSVRFNRLNNQLKK